MCQADVPSEVQFPLRKNLDSGRPEPVPSSGSTPFSHIPSLTRVPHAEYYQYIARLHWRCTTFKASLLIFKPWSMGPKVRVVFFFVHRCLLNLEPVIKPALQLLRRYGWVHRDVSSGNLLRRWQTERFGVHEENKSGRYSWCPNG